MGLMLKTRVFVEVRATNLTERYFAQFEIIMNYVIHHMEAYDIYRCNPYKIWILVTGVIQNENLLCNQFIFLYYYYYYIKYFWSW